MTGRRSVIGYALAGVVAVCPAYAAAPSEATEAARRTITAVEALDNYGDLQAAVRPSFILKYRIVSEERSSGQTVAARHMVQQTRFQDLGAQGNRVKICQQMWGQIGTRTVPQASPYYRSWVWSDGNYMRYTRSSRDQVESGAAPGRVFAYMSGRDEITDDRLTARMWGTFLLGYFPAAEEPFDRVIRAAGWESWKHRIEQVEGAPWHLIEAHTKHARYRIWLDPEHGFHVTRAEFSFHPGQGDPSAETGAALSWSMENVRFRRYDGLWFPCAADTYYHGRPDARGNAVTVKSRIEVIDLQVAPDHEALHSFTSDDIPDGAQVINYVNLNNRIFTAWDPEYRWRAEAEWVVDRLGRRTRYQGGSQLLPVVKMVPPLRELEIAIDPAQAQGRRILLCFGDFTQSPSQRAALQLNTRGQSPKSDVFIALLHCSQGGTASVQEWLQANRITLPVGVLRETVARVLRAWGVQKLPWLVVTDAEHVIVDEGPELSEMCEESVE